MPKQYISSIHYLRAICMLGVIGIHIGSFAFFNPSPSIPIVLLFEILSRYSVPAFFFLSAFGMFFSQPLAQSFHYKEFLTRRLRAVLFPYLGWTAIYLAYASLVTRSLSVWHPAELIKTLFYGLGCYHIYFMVILLWFYILMPLWRRILPIFLRNPLASFLLLFLFNLGFNYLSSYHWPFHPQTPWLKNLSDYRLNYLVLHYLFIFLFGAFAAETYPQFKAALQKHCQKYIAFGIFSAALMIAAFFFVRITLHYTPLEAVFTIHQLSPAGMLYTPSFLLASIAYFETYSVSNQLKKVFNALADHSYVIYLSHPLLLMLSAPLYERLSFSYTGAQLLLMYALTLTLSLLFSKILSLLPLPKCIRIFLIGK